MTQTKYHLYQPLTNELTRTIRKGMGESKRFASQEAITHLFAMAPGMLQTMDCLVLAEEHFWERSGKHVLFPLPEIIDELIAAKYQLGAEASFVWPYESAMVALPNTGPLADIPGVLITWHRHDERSRRITLPFLKAHKVTADIEERFDPALRQGDTLVAINYRIPIESNGTKGTARAVFPARNLPHLLAAENPEDFLTRLGAFDAYAGEEQLTHEEASVQLRLLKLVAGIALLNGIAPKTLLQPGLPGIRFAGAEKLPKGAGGVRFVAPQTERSVQGAKHRRWHFRTLRDERFYRGEHANKPRGSRVVFIPDALLGGGDAETFG